MLINQEPNQIFYQTVILNSLFTPSGILYYTHCIFTWT